MVKSLFDLENRTDLKTETLRIGKITAQEEFSIFGDNSKDYNFWELVNSCFELWPYRYTAENSYEFFKLKGISNNLQKMSNEEYFYYLQFILDFILWFDDFKNISINIDEFKIKLQTLIVENSLKLNMIVQNIYAIAELCNYNIEKIGNHYTFIKRDADVDSVLPTLENEENIRFALLEYNDFRIEKDERRKCELLIFLLKYMENNESIFKHHNQYKTLSRYANKFDIRHGDKKQLDAASNGDRIYILDTCFKLILHIIRDKSIKERTRTIDDKYFKKNKIIKRYKNG